MALAFGLARGLVVLSKTKSELRMKENLASPSVSLDPVDMAQLEALDRSLWCVLGNFVLKAGGSLWDTEEV